MNPKKYRWSKVYESAEEELLGLLQAKHIGTERHEVDAYENYEIAPSNNSIQLWGVEGTAKVRVGQTTFSMQPGDTLDIPPQTKVVVNTAFSGFAWHQSEAKA